jgi:2'-5' RNA ligase
MEGIRSFIAIEVPEPLQARMGALQQELKKFEPDIKWVRPGNIHLTLKFLGTVPKEILEKVSLAVSPTVLQAEPFDLRLYGLGGFPSSRNPRVLWVGIDQGWQPISSLQKAIEEKTAALSFPSERRPFKPHLTIGRVRSLKGKGGLPQAIEERQKVEIGAFRAKETILFQSKLTPAGAIYTKLKTFPMRASDV